MKVVASEICAICLLPVISLSLITVQKAYLGTFQILTKIFFLKKSHHRCLLVS